jgi:hypothetical protein
MRKKLTSIFSHSLMISLVLMLNPVDMAGQVSGTVFRDFNGNGTRESAEPLVAGIIVTAFTSSGTQCGTATTTSASAPNYSISGCSGQVRIEFEIPVTGCKVKNTLDYPSMGAAQYGSSIQFVNSTSTNVNFAIHYPGEYGGTASQLPKIYNVIMRAGDPVPSPAAPFNDPSYTANQPSVVSTDYLADGYIFSPSENWYAVTESQRQISLTTLALARQTGTVWGNSYSKQSSKLFVSAFLRRHAGMGPGGPGAIYMINTVSPDLTGSLLLVNLDALGFPTHAASGAMNIRNNVNRNLIAQPNYSPSTDAFAYEQVAKTSLGDLDISEDGRYLFVINLYDRKLYRIDLQNAQNPVSPTAAQISSYTIPDPCGSITDAGDFRPFALKIYRGKLYVGVTCSGQSASVPNPPEYLNTGMRFFVYEYDLGTSNTPSTPVSIYNQGVTYRNSDEIQASGNPPSGYGSAKWKPWRSDFRTNENHPLFTDIEFDNNGNLILGITDRNGYQTGGGNYDLNGNGPVTKAYANGDLIKLAKSDNCTFSLVSGSYYQNDFYEDQSRWCDPYSNGANPYSHGEITLGGVGIHHFGDRDEVIATALNPVVWASNGYIALNNSTGVQERANEIWYDNCDINGSQACFWKAGGVGDIEILEYTSPIELGNRVWNDTNGNGIQDAGEAGISGVAVQLYNAAGTTLISTATTDANGNYIFSSGTGTSTASFKYGITQLVPNTNYIIRVPASTGGLNLTTANAGSKNTIDSDAPSSGDVPVLATEIPISGANNHTFDIGYAPVSCSINLTTSPALCVGTNSNTYSLSGNITFTDPPSTGYLIVSVQGGASQVFSPPFNSPQAYNIEGLVADGVNRTATAYFSGNTSCTVSSSFTAPGAVGTGFFTFALNSVLADAYYGLSPHKSAYVESFSMPEYPNWGGLTGEAFDLDLTPQGATNLAGFCAELEESMGGTTHYYNKYSIIPLENVSRGWAGVPNTTSVHIPSGGIGKVRAGMLRYLFDNYYGGTDIASAVWTNNNAAAFQFAVWEIIHEVYTSNNSFSITNVTSNGFYTTSTNSPTITNLANSYLNAINALNWSNEEWMSYESQNYHVFAAENNPEDYQDFVFAQPLICAASCSLTSAGKTNEACNNNGTPAVTTDDYITFSLNPTGTGLGTGYTVTASGGATVTPTTGTYGSATNFRLQNGSANGTVYTITVTDNPTGTCTVTTTVQQNPCGDFTPPVPTCTPGTNVMHWTQSVNPVNGDASVIKVLCETALTYTIPSSNYPALLTSGVPVTVNISEVVAYDGYPGRSSVTQNNEQWRLIFKKAGSIVGTSSYTNDLPDLVEQGSWVGPLGTVTLPAGADEIIVEHWEVNNGTCESPNSVIPTSICLSVTGNCNLTDAGKTNEACNNNGTPSDPADDYITFSLNPTGTGLGTGYTVTVSGGATVTPTTGTYGGATNFRLQNGSANGTTYTITVTDNLTGTCQVTTTVMKTECSDCPATSYEICPGESFTLTVESGQGLTNIQWYKDGVAIPAPEGTQESYIATMIGTYTYTADGMDGCPFGLCCPVEIVESMNCCEIDIVDITVSDCFEGTYSIEVDVAYNLAQAGNIVLTINGQNHILNAAAGMGTMTFNISGLTCANGSGETTTVEVYSEDDPTCRDEAPINVPELILDMGDLPAPYATRLVDDGPRHTLTPLLYLGNCVDNELDGQPAPLAGRTIGGDDAGAQQMFTYGTCAVANDDENGLLTVTEISPGAPLKLCINASNTYGQDAYLTAWIDWNGNGILEAGEQVVNAIVSSGPLYTNCFTVIVPNTSVRDQDLGVRIRLNLNAPAGPTGLAIGGEVEDYMIRITCPDEPCLPAQISR